MNPHQTYQWARGPTIVKQLVPQPVPKTLECVREDALSRVGKRSPFEWVKRADVEAAFKSLRSLDPEHWAEVWGKIGKDYEAKGDECFNARNQRAAAEAHYQAYALFRVARFPVPSTPGKMLAYRSSVRNFLRAAKCFAPPLERVEIPFKGKKIVGYLQNPNPDQKPPLVMHWGGVDTWKEDRQTNSEALHKIGVATFTMDTPGTGENPLLPSDRKADRTFSAAIDYLQTRPDIDGGRIGVWGGSFGGYWATKLAFVEARRLRAAVNHGGGVHYGFQKKWLRRALITGSSRYLLGPEGLLEARTYVMGVKRLDELLQVAPKMSLKNQRLLDKQSAPLLVVNGKKDDQQPIEDVYLLLEYGNPKEARVYAEGGHMGYTPGTAADEILEMIVKWLKQKLTEQFL